MPVLLAALLILFGLVVAAVEAAARRLLDVGWSDWQHAAVIFGCCAFAAWALDRLGYRITMAVVLAVLLLALERQGVVTSLVLTAGMPWGSFYLFDTRLKVPLPRGLFGL